MASAVKFSDIRSERVLLDTRICVEKLMLPGEIKGASVISYTLPGGEKLSFEKPQKYMSIFFLLEGAVCFASEGKRFEYAEKAVFAALPDRDVSVEAKNDCAFIEIRWDMNEHDLADLEENQAQFPYTLAYKDTLQYRDFFKSEKTISRAIIPQAIIPRFAMGSVETCGDDLIGQHSHPLLDQLFFSFPENNMYMLIDSCIYPLEGNTLVHIPLGSNHGVIALGAQRAHYLWLDFTPQELKEQAVEYLNEIHVPT